MDGRLPVFPPYEYTVESFQAKICKYKNAFTDLGGEKWKMIQIITFKNVNKLDSFFI